ncbi:hypothetical protein C8J57DRAFT_1517826 [Mycena rebaudengoi]|nr:hypothetical protein C8J57DRAFT_1517826 [Mycena rebaudengoi]
MMLHSNPKKTPASENMGAEIASKAESHIHGLGQLHSEKICAYTWADCAPNACNTVTPDQRTRSVLPPHNIPLAPLLHDGECDLLPSLPTSNTPPDKIRNADPSTGTAAYVTQQPTSTSVLAQATYNPSSTYPTTSTSTPAYPSSTYPTSKYPASSAYAAPPTTYTSLESTVTPLYSVFTAHMPYSGVGAMSSGGEREPAQQQGRERGRVGYAYGRRRAQRTLRGPRRGDGCTVGVRGAGRGRLGAAGTMAQYAPGSTTTYAPGTSSPTPQCTTLGATPRTLTAGYEYMGRKAQGAGQGVVGQQVGFAFLFSFSASTSSYVYES